MFHAVTLTDFARRFTESRQLDRDYAATLRRRAAALEKFAGECRLALVLTEACINAFLASLVNLSPWTVKGYRGDLLTLWNSAADEGYVNYPVGRRIRRLRLPELLIDCYTISEARALISYASEIIGTYPNQVPKRDYWRAAILLGWDSGLRRGDVWRFDRSLLQPDGTLRIVQHKTNHVAIVQLRRKTVAAIDAIGTRYPCAWPLVACQFGEHFKKIVNGSGVNRGTFLRFLNNVRGCPRAAQRRRQARSTRQRLR